MLILRVSKVEMFYLQKWHSNNAVKMSHDINAWHQFVCQRFFNIFLIFLHNIFIRTINWWNYSIHNHLTFSLSMNFSSLARRKKTWTHKLTSQCHEFGSCLLIIFEGKIAQLCALVKSTIFIVLCISKVIFLYYVEQIFYS